ncbi:MAG: oxygen-independent coproporphyrinogen III oxidase [Halomonas sp.]|nr:oxygen-independent coproporphyrinogen III oxidase [Halomonas sp.]MDN6296964.1 oxygen-independent coproporphyrinogen III oxidase [Halomonas sp.]MDN6314488.1 oxygen-independent coproporphyrinogen III oxidase [Halomonas sp.]MDN6336813.1 oxygen-independent coproporphyrinogen III oxidase [Halomonas sp.]
MASAAPTFVSTAALSAARHTALLRRHASHRPGYMTYPAPHAFSGQFSAADFIRALERSNASGRGLSLYVHIPFCHKRSFLCACNRTPTHDPTLPELYLSRLDREMVLTARHLDTARPVEQLYWGGGTPALLSLGQMSDLFDRLDARFGLSSAPERDYAIEIDPREADVFTLRHLQLLGFNRISLGVQDLNPEVQQAINRVQPRAMTETLMEESHRLGFRSLRLELACGLPRQTLPGFVETLEQVIELNPARIAARHYQHRPRQFAAQRHINAADLPAPAETLAMLHATAERLGQAGYVPIGADHFARPDDSLVAARQNGTLQRNLQGYTSHANCDLLGLGVSAMSRIDDVYAQNPARLDRYANALDSGQLATVRGLCLSRDDLIHRAAIEALMCHARLDLAALGQRFQIDAPRYFSRALGQLAEAARDGLVKQSGEVITATPAGRLVLRQLAAAFDTYL